MIYLDLLLFLNFLLDFTLLLSVSYILNRNIKLRKIIYGSIIGVSIILGGFLEIAKGEFKNLYLFILLFISPIIMYLYYKQTKELKNNYSYYHKLDIHYKNKKFKLNAYLDTGNMLKDPYFNRDIIVINNILKNIDDFILVPIDTIDNHSLIKCIKVDKVLIDNKELSKKVLLGITNKKIQMEGIDSIIGLNLMEEIIC